MLPTYNLLFQDFFLLNKASLPLHLFILSLLSQCAISGSLFLLPALLLFKDEKGVADLDRQSDVPFVVNHRLQDYRSNIVYVGEKL